MKKILILLLAMMMIFLITGCSSEEPGPAPDEQNISAGEIVEQAMKAEEEAAAAKAEQDAAAFWEEYMEGCWTATDDQFAYFTWKDGKAAFFGGTWEDKNVLEKGAGLIIDFDQDSDTCKIKASWQEEGEIQEFVLDIAGIERDGKVNLTFEGETRTYALGGLTYDDAYDSVHDVQYADFGQICEVWDVIQGRWTAAGDRLVDFDYNENGDPTIVISQGDKAGKLATFEKAMTPLTYGLGEWNRWIFFYKNPVEFKEIYFDLSGLDRDGSINIRQGDDGDVYQLGRDEFY